MGSTLRVGAAMSDTRSGSRAVWGRTLAVALIAAIGAGHLWTKFDTAPQAMGAAFGVVLFALWVIVAGGIALVLTIRAWRRATPLPARAGLAILGIGAVAVAAAVATPPSTKQAIVRVRFSSPPGEVWVADGKCFDLGAWIVNAGLPSGTEGRGFGVSIRLEPTEPHLSISASSEMEGGHTKVDAEFRGELAVDQSTVGEQSRGRGSFAATLTNGSALEIGGAPRTRLIGSIEWACSGGLLDPLPEFDET